MTSRARNLTLLLSLVVVLVAALPALAQASPDGDDDPTYNAGSAFGTHYTLLVDFDDENADGSHPSDSARPVTDQAPDGTSVTAALVHNHASETNTYDVHLSRLGLDGLPAGFGTKVYATSLANANELLDIRVLANGQFMVLVRESGDSLVALTFDAQGEHVRTDTHYACGLGPAEPPKRAERGDPLPDYDSARLDAARVEEDGNISALWDCIVDEETKRLVADGGDDVYVVRYSAAGQTASRLLPKGDFGEDLELGPNGDPYALVGNYPEDGGSRLIATGTSSVFHLEKGTLALQPDATGSLVINGYPVDLAVDTKARPVVWTSPQVPSRGIQSGWSIYRVVPDLTALDGTWGDAGHAVVSNPRLGSAYGSYFGRYKQNFLTVRPDDRILATGQYEPEDTGRALEDYNNGIIAGLTAGGQLDTGFADNGFKPFFFAADDSSFLRIGEPTLQSDGKVLIPSVTSGRLRDRAAGNRIASPPSPNAYVAVTRLTGPASPVTPVTPSSPVRPSATPTICGRRAISLVRADVKGKKVKLTGLVGAALYGKKVTIQTDPKGARNSKFTKTGTVTASKTTGAFTATVPKPKASDFISVRYRAVSGTAKSPSLKLPQRLTSRSVKSAKNTITVKGKVKKSVLGKRNKVLIRRLVCGRYRTVGSARPDKNGNYTVTFASTQIRGVAFYRAESKVLRKPGSKKYVIQYARAIAIRTTSQTG